MAMLSVLGLYNFDSTLFDDMVIPTAADITTDAEKVDSPFIPVKDDLIAYICMECAELSLVYPSPTVMKDMIGVWSRVHLTEWKALYNTLLYKYNPIWNKDGTSTRTVKGDLHIMSGGSHQTTKADTTTTVQHDVTGYDANTYSADTKDTTQTTADPEANVGTFVYDSQKDHADYTDTTVDQGNIGVTSTMSMIREQREVVQFNLYQHIADEFKHHFCVMVY